MFINMNLYAFILMIILSIVTSYYAKNLQSYKRKIEILQAYVELIERFGWKSYTILYEDNQGLVRLQELLKSPTQSDVRIQVRQLPIDDDYR